MTLLVVGIDVGLEGAIAFLNDDGLLGIEDMPVDRVTVGEKVRGRISDVRLLHVLSSGVGAQAFIERPEGRPMRSRDKMTGQTVLRQPGAAGMLSLGESFGITRCACVAQRMSVTEIRPGEWKRGMGVPGDKDEARRRAAEMFPNFARMFALKKWDGRAEAALMALWGLRRIRGRG